MKNSSTTLRRGLLALALSSSVLLSSRESRAEGPYFGLDGAVLFGQNSTHDWATNCPSITTLSPGCSTVSPLGGAIEAHLGGKLGIVGLEVFGLGAGDWSSASIDALASLPAPDYLKSMTIGRVGGGIGGAARLFIGSSLLGLNGSFGGGAIFRHVYTNISSSDGSSTGYAAPILKADLGISLLGFLSIGAMGFIEFTPDVVVRPDLSGLGSLGSALPSSLGEVRVFHGNDYFLGPYIGLRFNE